MNTKPPEALNPLERLLEWRDNYDLCPLSHAAKGELNEIINARDGWVCVPVEQWEDFHKAFKGAFDTPVAWKRVSGEYAEDARRRENEMNEAMIHASQHKDNANER